MKDQDEPFHFYFSECRSPFVATSGGGDVGVEISQPSTRGDVGKVRFKTLKYCALRSVWIFEKIPHVRKLRGLAATKVIPKWRAQ